MTERGSIKKALTVLALAVTALVGCDDLEPYAESSSIDGPIQRDVALPHTNNHVLTQKKAQFLKLNL